MKKISLFYKNKDEIYESVRKIILDSGFSIDDDNPDIVIVIGGDGTFLRAVHKYLNKLDSVLFIGINTGNLGHFMKYKVEEIQDVLSSDKYEIEEFKLLKGLFNNKNTQKEIYAVNEIRIENPFHTLISDVYINNEHFEKFRGNGLVVSSSVGSSAYNKSLGGAVVDTDLDILELTEIAPIQNKVYSTLGSSLVLSNKNTISLKGDFKNVIVGYDFESFSLNGVDSIDVLLSEKTVKLIKKEKQNSLESLKRSFI